MASKKGKSKPKTRSSAKTRSEKRSQKQSQTPSSASTSQAGLSDAQTAKPSPEAVSGMGRPSDYTPEIGLLICELMTVPLSLSAICELEGMPSRRTVVRWCHAHEDFRLNYARAQVDQAEAYADEQIRLSDESPRIATKQWGTEVDTGWVQQQKLKVESRRWAYNRILGGRNSAKAQGEDKDKAPETINLIVQPKPTQ